MTVTESVGDHAVFVSHQKAVAILIEAADSDNRSKGSRVGVSPTEVIRVVPLGTGIIFDVFAPYPKLRFCGKVDGCQLGLPSDRISAMTIGPTEMPPSAALPVKTRK